jgi:hypothetical protein
MLLAVAAMEGLVLRQFDIRKALLNGNLQEVVFIKGPARAEQEAMGGCCSFGVLFMGCAKHHGPGISLEAELSSRAFVQSDADPALWIWHSKKGIVMTMFYVDDAT